MTDRNANKEKKAKQVLVAVNLCRDLIQALVHQLELLILDESNASLNPDMRESLCRILPALWRTTTVFSISHQLEFFTMADYIYDMGEGSVWPVRT